MDNRVGYEERLRAPLWIWFITAVLSATFGFAFGVYFGIIPGAAIAIAAEAFVAWRLVAAAARVAVGDGVLTAGRARLPYAVISDVTPLDRADAAHLRGRGADPRAFMLLRPWIDRAVRVDLRDDRDPTPYWYVSTRRPGKLAAAIGAAAFARHPGEPKPPAIPTGGSGLAEPAPGGAPPSPSDDASPTPDPGCELT